MSREHGNARLTLEQCAMIRAKAAEACPCCGRRTTLRAVGAEYGISAVAVHKILKTRRWGEPA